MTLLTEKSAARVLRNAFHKKTIVRGPCGTYDACGAFFTDYTPTQGEFYGGLTATRVQRLPKSDKRCPLCAFLESRSITLAESDPEGKMAEILGVEREWVISFLQGFDGDDEEKNHAYRIGRRIAKKVVE
jgi:hypothetical protein